MGVRLQTYVGLLYQNLARRKQTAPRGKLPAVLPVVLHNGVRRWNVPTQLTELIDYMPEELRQHCPRLCYFLIDAMALPERVCSLPRRFELAYQPCSAPTCATTFASTTRTSSRSSAARCLSRSTGCRAFIRSTGARCGPGWSNRPGPSST